MEFSHDLELRNEAEHLRNNVIKHFIKYLLYALQGLPKEYVDRVEDIGDRPGF
jgi:hypothetical protein